MNNLLNILIFALVGVAFCRVPDTQFDVVNYMATTMGFNTSTAIGWDPTEDPCDDQWTGVTCNPAKDSVTGLNFGYSGLSGELPPNIGDLPDLKIIIMEHNSITGQIPASFWTLTQLTFVSLRNNQLTGSLPAAMGALINCDKLFLENNNFNGPIPAQLFDMAALTYVDLTNNSISGSIPPEIENADALKNFYIENNQLSGTIPFEMAGADSLKFIKLGNNDLEGKIPDFTQAFKLRVGNFEVQGNSKLGCHFPEFLLNPVFEFNVDGIPFLCPLPTGVIASPDITCVPTNIDSISPDPEIYNDQNQTVTLTGTGLQPLCDLEVFFGQTSVIPQTVSSTQIVVTMPLAVPPSRGAPVAVTLHSDGRLIAGAPATTTIIQHCPIGPNTQVCSGQGICNEDYGTCTCEITPEAFFGDSCELDCPNTCSDRGTCYFLGGIGACKCDEGYLGTNCEIRICADPKCAGNGVCDLSVGQCSCNIGYLGPDCVNREPCAENYKEGVHCDPAKGARGNCFWPPTSSESICQCDENWYGLNCDEEGGGSDFLWLFIVLIIVAVILIVALVIVFLKCRFNEEEAKAGDN